MDIETLAGLSGSSRRTIRFYVQEGLLAPPEGQKRAARYSDDHLERLLRIRRLQQEGLSLEAIRRHLDADIEPGYAPPRPGSVEVWSRIHIADGVEIHVEPGRARLSSDAIRDLATRARGWLEEAQAEQKGDNK